MDIRGWGGTMDDALHTDDVDSAATRARDDL